MRAKSNLGKINNRYMRFVAWTSVFWI